MQERQNKEREDIRCNERNHREGEKILWLREKVGERKAGSTLGIFLLVFTFEDAFIFISTLFFSKEKYICHGLVGDFSVGDTVRASR